MATITENLNSGAGDEAGQRGFRARKEYHVVLRDAGDDVNDPLTPLEALVPIGTQHPEPLFAGLFASRYRKLQREDGTTDIWRAEVIFESPLVFPSTGAWNVSFNTSLQTHQPALDLKEKRIGGLAYIRASATGPLPFSTHIAHTVDLSLIDI